MSFWQALRFWFKLGFISFGGPAGQIAIMHEELVVRRRWLSEKRFLHALNYCMVLPGPEAQQLATYIGWLMHKTRGGIAAGALFVLPSLFMMIGLSWLYIAFGHVTWVAGMFYGIKPAVTAIVVQAAHRIGSRALKNNFLIAIAAASFVAIFALNVPFPIIVVVAALVGLIGGRMSPASFSASGGHASTQASFGPALIDDHTPTPSHAMFTWKRFLKVLLAGAVLWTMPMAFLMMQHGWDHTLTQMSWFFTKAALLTFGGAYAVLPYVYQGTVEQFGWVTATQAHHLRVDGHTAVHHRHLEPERIPQVGEHVADLHRQLARGHQHQRAHRAAKVGLSWVQHMLLHQRQGKRQGFA